MTGLHRIAAAAALAGLSAGFGYDPAPRYREDDDYDGTNLPARVYFGEPRLLPPAPAPKLTKRQRRRLRGRNGGGQ